MGDERERLTRRVMLWVTGTTTLHLVGAASAEGAEQDERRDRALAELEDDR
jgi:hypothetical protein